MVDFAKVMKKERARLSTLWYYVYVAEKQGKYDEARKIFMKYLNRKNNLQRSTKAIVPINSKFSFLFSK